MNELFIEEFKISDGKRQENRSNSEEAPLAHHPSSEDAPFTHLRNLENVILQKSKLPERFIPFIEDIHSSLEDEDLPKVFFLIDLIEEFLDLELSSR